MNLKPLGDRVIVKRDEAESATSAGLLIASTSKEKPQTGIVVAVGEGKMLECGKLAPMVVKKGDTVLFAKYSGNEVKVDNEDYLIIRQSDILAIL